MDIYDLAKHLPDGVHWGDEITPMILDEIVTPLLESAYRADRKAREECCEIVRSRKVAIECALESDEAYNMALTHAEQAIRDTIQEE